MIFQHQFNRIKNFFSQKPVDDAMAVKIVMYQIENASEETRYVLAAHLADHLSRNLKAVPVKLLKDLKRGLQAFDAREGVWKENEHA